MATLERQLTGSVAIEDFNYNPITGSLEIIFKRGGETYTYLDVPATIYAGLLSASSKGTYFNVNIRNIYTFTRG